MVNLPNNGKMETGMLVGLHFFEALTAICQSICQGLK